MGKTAIPEAKRGSIFLVDPDNLTIIGLDTTDGPGHELWQEGLDRPLDPAMVESVLEHGVLEDVGVRVNGTYHEVVRGRHRVMWARAANEKLRSVGKDPRLVPCVVVRVDPRTAAIHMVVENEHRKTPDGPMVRARHVQRMLTAGHDRKDIARAFNVSVQSIGEWLKILDLAAPVQDMLEAGKISASTASALAGLEHKEQVATAKEIVANGGGSVEAKRVVKSRGPRANAASKPDESSTVAPGKVILRKVVAHAAFAELDPSAQAVLRWAAGAGTATRIKGLSAIVAAVTGGTA